MILNLSTAIENNSSDVEVCRVITDRVHDVFGPLTFTQTDLLSMIVNFNDNARGLSDDDGPMLQFDYKHNDEDKAAGWIRKLYLSDCQEKLMAQVEWTPNAVAKIKNKEYKFTSPAIIRGFTNKSTNKKYNIILKGAALTNIPFLTDMSAVTCLSESQQLKFQNEGNMSETTETPPTETIDLQEGVTKEQVLEMFKTLPLEDQKIVLKELKLTPSPPNELEQTELAVSTELSENYAKLTEKVNELTQAAVVGKRENNFLRMLSEGKVVPAQYDSFLENDMIGFAQNASTTLNLDQRGSGVTPEIKLDSKDKAQELLIKLAEEYAKENNCAYGTALKEITLTNQETATLALKEV